MRPGQHRGGGAIRGHMIVRTEGCFVQPDQQFREGPTMNHIHIDKSMFNQKLRKEMYLERAPLPVTDATTANGLSDQASNQHWLHDYAVSRVPGACGAAGSRGRVPHRCQDQPTATGTDTEVA